MSTVTTTAANNVAAIVEQYRYAEAQLHRRRQALCGPSLTDREALRLIYAAADSGAPCTPRDVAAALHITAASTTTLLDRLQGASLIVRTPNPDDRRSVLLKPVDRRQDPDSIDPLTERIATLAATLPEDERGATGHPHHRLLRQRVRHLDWRSVCHVHLIGHRPL